MWDRRLPRPTVARKVALLLLLPVLGSLAVLAVFSSSLRQDAHDGRVMNLAGRQRTLAVAVGDYAQMVALGQEADRPQLAEVAEAFDSTLRNLQREEEQSSIAFVGVGEGPSGIGEVVDLWLPMKIRLDVIVAEPSSTPAFADAGRYVERHRRELIAAIDRFAATDQIRSHGRRERMLRVLSGVVALSVLVLFVGMVLARHYITGPVERLVRLARVVGAGEELPEARVGSADELGDLERALYEMAGSLASAAESRRRAAEADAFVARLLEAAPVAIVEVGPGGEVEVANERFAAWSGRRPEDLQGQSFAEALSASGEVRGRAEAWLRSVRGEGEASMEIPLGPGEGRRVLFTGLDYPCGSGQGENGVLGVGIDLSVLREAEAELEGSRQSFNAVVERHPDGLLVLDEEGRVAYRNEAASHLIRGGLEAGDPFGRPPDRGMVTRVDVVRGGGGSGTAELRAMPTTWMGRDATLVILRDVTERLRAQEELARSEESFRTLIEQSPDAVAVHRGGRLVYCNPALLRTLGYESEDELVGEPVSILVHPEELPLIAARVQEMLASGEVAPPREERFLCKDGSVVYAEVAAMPLVYLGEPAIVVIGRDLSERRELTARMMEMDRMIAVGTLAAGVGHEINNPLTYVGANAVFAVDEVQRVRTTLDAIAAEIARRHGAEGAEEILTAAGSDRAREALTELDDLLRDVKDGSDRIRDIVRDLKTFSRGDDERREPVDVVRALESALDMAANEVRHRARVVRDLGPVPPVLGNENRLSRVFLNLLVNAAHAIPEGAARGNEIRVTTAQVDGQVSVEVTDTGSGIQPNDLARLFDPFFTTKPLGQGTGLGLSICHQIVEAHGGRIQVDSELGRGTTFRVLLPIVGRPEGRRDGRG